MLTLNRAVLQAPFTPFIVVFCNAILHYDPSDLNALSDFVHSLESCRTVSEGADKLYRMCHLFLQVAKLYVETKTKESTGHAIAQAQENTSGVLQTSGSQDFDLSAMSQFDPYLSALGLMPNSAWPMADYVPLGGTETGSGVFPQTAAFEDSSAGGGFSVQTGNHNTVQDWFSGSTYLMNVMMEDDIQMPDFNL